MSQIKDLTTTITNPATTDLTVFETTGGVDQKIAFSDLKTSILAGQDAPTNNARLFDAIYMLFGDYDASEMIATAVLTGTDGAALVAGQIVLRNHTSNMDLNGLWVIQTAGSAVRYDKCNTNSLIFNSYVTVKTGDYAGQIYQCITYPATFEVDDIEYERRYFATQQVNADSDVTFDSVIFDDATVNTVPYLDGTKKLVSSAVTPTELGYLSGATSSVQTQLNALTPKYGGFYSYGKAIPFNITVADTYHAFRLVTAGDVLVSPAGISGFTFSAGRTVDANITSEASGTGGLLRIVCSAAHGLTTGEFVVLGNMNDAGHNKPTFITTDETNPTTEFLCDDIAYIDSAGASSGTVDEPSHLHASVGSAGIYCASFTIDGTASNVNKNWKWELNVNLLSIDDIVTERNTTNTLASMTTSGNVAIADNDIIWLSGRNSTDTTDYTIKNMGLHLHKIIAT